MTTWGSSITCFPIISIQHNPTNIPSYMGELIVFYNLIGTLLLENNCTDVNGITLA